MANCKLMTVAKRRHHGTFKHLTLHIDFYDNSGKGTGANMNDYNRAKEAAQSRFKRAFDCFLASCGWDYRVSFEFGDGE